MAAGELCPQRNTDLRQSNRANELDVRLGFRHSHQVFEEFVTLPDLFVLWSQQAGAAFFQQTPIPKSRADDFHAAEAAPPIAAILEKV
jgi:hypothetical protein